MGGRASINSAVPTDQALRGEGRERRNAMHSKNHRLESRIHRDQAELARLFREFVRTERGKTPRRAACACTGLLASVPRILLEVPGP